MIIEVTRPVPGLVNFRELRPGDVTELDDGAAGSLIADGYATEVVRSTPDKAAETAVDAPRGRGRPKS